MTAKAITTTQPATPAEPRRSAHVVVSGFLNENHCESFADELKRAFIESGQTLTVSVLPMTPAEADRLANRLVEPARAAAHYTRSGVLPDASRSRVGRALQPRSSRSAGSFRS